MIFDTAGCGRRKGSPLRSDERAGERAPLTAATSGQIIQLSGAKERKKNSARDNKNQERRLHKIAHTTLLRRLTRQSSGCFQGNYPARPRPPRKREVTTPHVVTSGTSQSSQISKQPLHRPSRL